MGDMKEDFEALKAYNKARINKNYEAACSHKGLQELGFVHHTAWHWQRYLDGDLLDYWPSRSRWHWRGKTHRGTPEAMYNFIKKRLNPNEED